MNTRMLTLFTALQLTVRRCAEDEDGQGITEYGLILVLVAVVAIAALTFFGGKVTSMLSTVANSV
jgi:Flp pilus assembly pilin Flp